MGGVRREGKKKKVMDGVVEILGILEGWREGCRKGEQEQGPGWVQGLKTVKLWENARAVAGKVRHIWTVLKYTQVGNEEEEEDIVSVEGKGVEGELEVVEGMIDQREGMGKDLFEGVWKAVKEEGKALLGMGKGRRDVVGGGVELFEVNKNGRRIRNSSGKKKRSNTLSSIVAGVGKVGKKVTGGGGRKGKQR